MAFLTKRRVSLLDILAVAAFLSLWGWLRDAPAPSVAGQVMLGFWVAETAWAVVKWVAAKDDAP